MFVIASETFVLRGYSIHDRFYSKFEKLFNKLNLEAEMTEDVDDDEHYYDIRGTHDDLVKFLNAVQKPKPTAKELAETIVRE